MILDLIFIALLALALFRGWQRGLVVAVFSLLGWILGLAAALKLSATVAHRVEPSLPQASRWLPVLAFLAVFLATVLVVRLLARLLQTALDLALLGWINRLGGFLFYAMAYLAAYSVFLFYAQSLGWISAAYVQQSRSYAWVEPWGPWIIDGLGKLWPVFAHLFEDLKDFFGHFA